MSGNEDSLKSVESAKPMFMLGSRYYIYDKAKEDFDVVRILKQDCNTKGEVAVLEEKTKKKKLIPQSILLGKYTRLLPDGFAIFSIVKVSDHKDVIISLFRQSDILQAGNAIPYAVCRQACHDIFSQISQRKSMLPTVGISISLDTCPPNIRFQDILAADEVVTSYRLAVYQEDDIDMMLSIVPTRKFDQVLREYELINRNEFFGLCDTLKDLMNSNKFMRDFNAAFGILEVPFDPKPDEDGYLSKEALFFIEDHLKTNIINTYVIEYGRDVDEETLARTHVKVVGPGKRKVYIVGYDKAEGKYVPRITPTAN